MNILARFDPRPLSKKFDMRSRFLFLSLSIILSFTAIQQASAQKKAVIAYYSGSLEALDSFSSKNMTHIIYCFGHLKGNKLHLGRQRDTLLIQKMVAMKKTNKDLKVLLSLGGWGGCAPCSDVFNSAEGRTEFVRSVKELTDYFKSDGIDLDWEYPTIEGYPGHKYMPADKQNFTDLVMELRKVLGKKSTITFAAGGFQKFLEESVDWNNVMKYVDYVNLMTYDLVNGYSTVTGHHTGLYSTPSLKESTDNCVTYLIKAGVDPGKLIIGAAFYSRVWENVADINNGLYQSGKFKGSFGYDKFPERLKGFTLYWDDVAKAPYAYNAAEKLFATYDDKRSIEAKTRYVLDKKLGGIMFWHLGHDTAKDGLVDTINKTLKK
jgi:chitinase